MDRILTIGSTGSDVSELQALLNRRPPTQFPPLKIDNIFGPKTSARVKEFQRNNGLQIDGIVGPKTAAALPTIAPVVAISEPIPATLKQATEPAVYDSTSAADAQLCNVERGFRAGRMSLDEFRQIKKVLQEE
jgi:peptidoglycan hydrolase-like protein with peptidoglycan-binding domain